MLSKLTQNLYSNSSQACSGIIVTQAPEQTAVPRPKLLFQSVCGPTICLCNRSLHDAAGPTPRTTEC